MVTFQGRLRGVQRLRMINRLPVAVRAAAWFKAPAASRNSLSEGRAACLKPHIVKYVQHRQRPKAGPNCWKALSL
jgi:hypothetical protein